MFEGIDMMDKYMEFSYNLEKKQILERIYLELEFIFIICMENEANIDVIYNDVKSNIIVSKEDFRELFLIAVDKINLEHKASLIVNNDEVIWVNELNDREIEA